MKDKILAELKAKYSGQLTSKFMESLSERLATKVTKEEDIQGVISELENSPIKITDLQTEGDRRATELQKRNKELQDEINALKVRTPEPPAEPPKPGAPDWAKDLQSLRSELDSMKKADQQRQARAALVERAKEKKIPSLLVDGVMVDSIDEVNEIVSKLEEKATALKQELINEGLAGKPPAKPSGVYGAKEQIANDIKAHPIIKK